MKHKLRITLIALGLLAVSAFVFRESIYRGLAAYLVKAGDPQSADMVVVLAGIIMYAFVRAHRESTGQIPAPADLESAAASNPTMPVRRSIV